MPSGPISPSIRAPYCRALPALLAALLALAGAGCGVIHGATIFALLPDERSAPPPAPLASPPTAAVDPIPRVLGPVPIGYRLIDANSDRLTAEFEYSTNAGASFSPATLAPGALEGTSGLASSPGGVPHVFLWDAARDLGPGAFTRVRFRVTPSDGTATGTAGVSPLGVVGNAPPSVAVESVVRREEGNTKIATVSLTVTDSTSDLVDLDIVWEVVASSDPSGFPAGRTGTATILAGDVSNVASDPLGLPRSFVWNLVNDFQDLAVANLRLSITPRDSLERGAAALVDGVFWVRDDRPVAFFLPVPRQTGAVLADYSLITVDERSDLSVSVSFQVGDASSGAFPETPVAGVDEFPATIVSPVSGLAAAPLGFGHILVWDAPRDLATLVPGAPSSALVRLKMTPAAATSIGSPAFSNGFVAGNEAPSVALETIPTPQGGVVPVRFSLIDRTADPARVALAFTAEGSGSFEEIPPHLLVGATASLATSPAGRRHTVFWNAFAQLGQRSVTGVAVRVTPSDTTEGRPATSNTFDLEVSSRPIAAIEGPLTGVLSGSVEIAYKLFQAEGSTCDVEVFYRVGPSGPTRAATRLAGAGEGTRGLATSLLGAAHVFAWDLAADFREGGRAIDASEVLLTIAPRNAEGPGIAGTAGPFSVNQNLAPEASVTLGAAALEAPFRVPISLSVTDPEGDTASVAAEVRLTSPTVTAFLPLKLVDAAGAPLPSTLSTPPVSGLALAWDARAQLEELGVGGAALESVAAEVRFTPSDGPDPLLGGGTPGLASGLFDLTAPPTATGFRIAGRSPGETISGVVAFELTLSDPEGGLAEVVIEESQSPFRPIRTVELVADGGVKSIAYDTLFEGRLGITGTAEVAFRPLVRDLAGPKKSAGPGAALSFVADNRVRGDTPALAILSPRAGALASEQPVDLLVVLGEPGSVSAEVLWSEGSAATFPARILDTAANGAALRPDGRIPTLTASPEGSAHRITWLVGAQPELIGRDLAGVTLTVLVRSASGRTAVASAGPLAVDNNRAPVASGLALLAPAPPAAPFRVTVEAAVADPDDTSAELRLELLLAGRLDFVPLALTGAAAPLAQPVLVPAGATPLLSRFVWDAKEQLRSLGVSGSRLHEVAGFLRAAPRNIAPNAQDGAVTTTAFTLDLFARPAIANLAPPAGAPPHAGVIEVGFDLVSPDGGRTEVVLEARDVPPGDPAPSPGELFEQARQVVLPGPGRSFLLDTRAGLVDPGEGRRDVYLRLRAIDLASGVVGPASAILGPIPVDNDASGALVVEIVGISGLDTGRVQVFYLLRHPTISSASVRVDVEASGRTFTATLFDPDDPDEVTAQDPLSGVSAEAGALGVLNVFNWYSRADLPASVTGEARIRITPLSPSGTAVVSDPLVVKNRAAASFVLGQPGPDAGSVNGFGLHLVAPGEARESFGPLGIGLKIVGAIDAPIPRVRVGIPDARNHRVLFWRGTPLQGLRSPDQVLGQGSPFTHARNRGRPLIEDVFDASGAAVDPRLRFDTPIGVAFLGEAEDDFDESDDEDLTAIVDAGNRRVIVLEGLADGAPTEVRVIGQPDPRTSTPSALPDEDRFAAPIAAVFARGSFGVGLLVADAVKRVIHVVDPSVEDPDGYAPMNPLHPRFRGNEATPSAPITKSVFQEPVALALSHDGNHLFVADRGSPTDPTSGAIWVAVVDSLFSFDPNSPTPATLFARLEPYVAGARANGVLEPHERFRPGGVFCTRDPVFGPLLCVTDPGAGAVYGYPLAGLAASGALGGAKEILGVTRGAVSIGVGGGGSLGAADFDGRLETDLVIARGRNLLGGGGAYSEDTLSAASDLDRDDGIELGLIAIADGGAHRVLIQRAPLLAPRASTPAQTLVVNELHPDSLEVETSEGSAEIFEWVEVLNTGRDPVDLDDVRISDCAGGALTGAGAQVFTITRTSLVLAPGERAVLVFTAPTALPPLLNGYFEPAAARVVISTDAGVDFMPLSGGAVALFRGEPLKPGFTAYDYVAYPPQAGGTPVPPPPPGFFWSQPAGGLLAGSLACSFFSSGEIDDRTWHRVEDGIDGDRSLEWAVRSVTSTSDEPNSGAGRPNPPHPFVASALPVSADLPIGRFGQQSADGEGPNDRPASDASFLLPAGVSSSRSSGGSALDARLAVADRGNNRVLLYTGVKHPSEGGAPASAVLGQPDFSSSAPGSGPEGLSRPEGVLVDPTRADHVYVADTGNGRLLRYQAPFFDGMTPVTAGSFLRDTGDTAFPGGAPELFEPCDVQIGSTRTAFPDTSDADLLYVLERGEGASDHTGRLWIFRRRAFGSADWRLLTSITRTAAGPLLSPSAVFGTRTHLFIADTGNDRVLVFETATPTEASAPVAVLGGAGASGAGRLRAPSGLFSTEDTAPGGAPSDYAHRLFVADSGGDRVLVYRYRTDPLAPPFPALASEVLGQERFDDADDVLPNVALDASDPARNAEGRPSARTLVLEPAPGRPRVPHSGISVLVRSGPDRADQEYRVYVSDPGNDRVLVVTDADAFPGERLVLECCGG